MTDCTDRFREIRRESNRVLDEDLEALERRPERDRIRQYNDLRRLEERFRSEFLADCPDFLTDSERDRVRGEIRLGRLLLAASFYADGDLPAAMAGDWSDVELQAVVDFDRYRAFDSLSDEQIERRIRRMDGEVYELVAEYTSTQLATVETLLDHPDVQQDVLERLLARYEDRRERIREGFFTYVETHGLEHTVAAIEDAVRAVAQSSSTRASVRAEVDATLSKSTSAGADAERAHEDAIERLTAGVERVERLQSRLEDRMDELERAREAATEADGSVAGETVELVEGELAELRAERDRLDVAGEQLDRERSRVAAAADRLDRRREAVSGRTDADGGIDGTNVVPAPVARLYELDYLGRFDIAMEEVPQVHTPDGDVRIPDGYWNGPGASFRQSERPRVASLLADACGETADDGGETADDGGETADDGGEGADARGENAPDARSDASADAGTVPSPTVGRRAVDADPERDPDRYPQAGRSRYEIRESRHLGLHSTTTMAVEAVVHADLESYVTRGFDDAPADLDAFLGYVNDAVARAERRGHAYLLAVASPTGWTDRVRDHVAESRTRVGSDVALVLVDLRSGEVVHDESDPLADENVALFEPPTDDERIAEVVETVRREYVDDVGTDSVRVERVADDHGYQPHLVTEAFHELEADGAGELLYVDDLGLCLECGL
ncbi:MAG: hypothetical protein ABEI96_07045 [Haloarculaceae archaeon]